MQLVCISECSKILFGDLEIGDYYRIGNKIYVKSSKYSAIDLDTQELLNNNNDNLLVEMIEIIKIEYKLI